MSTPATIADRRTATDPATPLLVSAAELAELLSLSIATVRRLDSAGKLPRPVRLGGAVRWRMPELAAWTEAGCPDRQTWEATR